MAALRKPLQGLWNVVRFNWHFYLVALGAALVLAAGCVAAPPAVRHYLALALGVVLVPVVASLLVTAYVYDFSDLYRLSWLPVAPVANSALLTINAGFDEISPMVAQSYSPGSLQVLDFYDPARHTEVSIERARRASHPYPGTRAVDTRAPLPLPSNSVDVTFAFLAAHEIRDAQERAGFFREIERVSKPHGRIVVTEHLRDAANFLAYTVGFLHFHSRRSWLATFAQAGLCVEQEIKVTPFVTSFILRKNGSAA
ncbi:MAG TPA: methyltransferase domain-containing protein [Hymenobacter sp.]|jgi:SAM-dependent methyltransferase|uniref:class I SAM-dependent methyltransferase n=1 Tax=Hymenobacter sp. TaxID=1898978 RepID=UPI002EDB65EE